MIIYAMAAGSVSIAKLFMAGVVPGVLLGISLMIYSYFVSVKRNYPKEESFSLKKLFIALKESIFGLMTIVIIMVGVLTGIFTATESAAIASVWAVIVTFFIYREVPFKEMWNILTKTLKTLAIIMILIGISTAFGWLIAYLKVPSMIISSIMGLTSNPIFILLLINTILLFLGMIMDMSSIIVIATPILLPIATSIGIDPVHFGVIMILNLGIGLITPPVGGVLYVCSGITGMKIEALTKAMFSFYVVMLIVLILVTYVPAVSMTLPNMMFK
jgi:tripartite ATP-independent transporter DctM subunit